jgi:hypothetical protein
MANGHDLYPGSGLADELISANAMRPYANTFKDIYRGMMEGRKVALAEKQARDIEYQRRFMREEERRKAREAAYPTSGGGTAGGTTGSTGGTGGTGILSGEVAGVPYSVRSESDILAELLAPGTASLQSAQVGDMFSDKGLMARIARGKEEGVGDIGGGYAGRNITPSGERFVTPEALRIPGAASRTFAPGPPAGTERRGEPSADKFMAKVAGIDDKAKQERMDTTRLIQSLVKGGLIPEETLYSGTPEEAAEEISNLLAGLSPGVLQQRIESVEGYEGVPMADFERLKAEAAKMSSQELQAARDEARAKGVKGALAVLKSDPIFKDFSDEAASYLANLQMTKEGFGRFKEFMSESGQTYRKVLGEEGATARNNADNAVLWAQYARQNERAEAREAALGRRYFEDAKRERGAALNAEMESAESAASVAETQFQDVALVVSGDGDLQSQLETARRLRQTSTKEELLKILVDADVENKGFPPEEARKRAQIVVDYLRLDVERAVLASKAKDLSSDIDIVLSGKGMENLQTGEARDIAEKYYDDLDVAGLEAKAKSPDSMRYEEQSRVRRETLESRERIAEARNKARALTAQGRRAGGLTEAEARSLAQEVGDALDLDNPQRSLLFELSKTPAGRKKLLQEADVNNPSETIRMLQGLGMIPSRTGGGGSPNQETPSEPRLSPGADAFKRRKDLSWDGSSWKSRGGKTYSTATLEDVAGRE